MCSFDLSLPAVDGETLVKTAVMGVTKTSTPGMAFAVQVNADTWHRPLGHMNPDHVELLRKTEGNGVEYTGTVSGCDICAVGKSTQKGSPEKYQAQDRRINGIGLFASCRAHHASPEEDTITSASSLAGTPG